MKIDKLPKIEDAKTDEVKLPPLEIMDLEKLFESKEECPPEVISGVLHQGSKMSINGGSKSYKTWAMVDLAVSVATGNSWWGFDTKKGDVLYVNFEIQDCFFCRRIEAIIKGKGLKSGLPKNFKYLGLRGKSGSVESFVSRLISKVSGKRYSIIIIDPLYKLLGYRDENKAGDIASLLNELERLAVESGAAIVYGHHFSKGNQAQKDVLDRGSGSGVFARDPDTLLTMTRHEADEAYVVEPILRNFAPIEPFVLRWDYPVMVRDADLNPKSLKRAGQKQKLYGDDEILGELSEGGLSHGDWQMAVCKKTHISTSGFSNRIKQLEVQGLVKKNGRLWVKIRQKKVVKKTGTRTSFKKKP